MSQIKTYRGFTDIPGWKNRKPQNKINKIDIDRSKRLLEHPSPIVKAWLDKFEFSDTKEIYKKD